MQRDFEPTYTNGVEGAFQAAPTLQHVMLRGDVVTPDIQTVELLSCDIRQKIETRHKNVAKHAIGVFKNIRDAGYANRTTLGDAVADETFVQDLLYETNRKPLVANTDTDGTLRGVLFELERRTEDSLSEVWKSVGQGYSSVYLLAARGDVQEEKAVSVLRGTGLDTSAELTPWFIKVGFADKQTAQSIRETLQLQAGEDPDVTSEAPTSLLIPGIFQSALMYKNFIEFIRKKGLLSVQPVGVTLERYEENVRYLADETYFIDSIGTSSSSNSRLLLTEAAGAEDLESELLYKDAFSSLESRLVAGRFIVQTAACFADGLEWLKIEEIEEASVPDINELLKSVKIEAIEETKRMSIL